MDFLMSIWNFFATNILTQPAYFIGLMVFVGYMLLRKPLYDALAGFIKATVGYMILAVGSGGLTNNFRPILVGLKDRFNLDAMVIDPYFGQNAVTAGIGEQFGRTFSQVMLLLLVAFIMNLVFAKFTPFKSIFLTGQHFLYFACVIALVFIANDMPMAVTVVVGGIMLGFCGAALPTLCQRFMKDLTGADNLSMGHFNCLGYAFSGYVGLLFEKAGGNKEKSDASNVNMPKFFELFRDFVFSVALFMVVLFYIAVIACVVNGHMDVVLEKSGNNIWFIYPFLQGLQFAAGMSVLIYGVRQFIAEITAAFVAISEKYIPNSKPAVDCPAIFPFAPTAVLIGFVGSFLGGLVAMAIMVAMHSSTIMIPAAGICFFSGGTCGVFGNIHGGWKGALVGSFIVGMALTGLPLILYPAFAALGIADASFPNVDYNILGAALNAILGIFH